MCDKFWENQLGFSWAWCKVWNCSRTNIQKRVPRNLQWKPSNTVSLQCTLCKTCVQITLRLHNPLNCWHQTTLAFSLVLLIVTQRQGIITELQAAGSVIFLEWIRWTYLMLYYQSVKLYKAVLITEQKQTPCKQIPTVTSLLVHIFAKTHTSVHMHVH